MGLLNQSQSSYYTGNDYGNYQFVSLQDVINQFMVAYVGEGKIINSFTTFFINDITTRLR